MFQFGSETDSKQLFKIALFNKCVYVWQLKMSFKQVCRFPYIIYCRAELYAGHVACCSLVNHGEYANGTDRRTDAGSLHCAFR